MRIKSVGADVVAVLACLAGSWSCGVGDGAGNVGAAQLDPRAATAQSENESGGDHDEKGACSRTGSRRPSDDEQKDECSPTGIRRSDYLLPVASTLPFYLPDSPGQLNAAIDIHRVSPIYEHGRCGDRRATRAVILLHGANTESVTTFDLQYPDVDHPDYSLMEHLARAGIDAFAVNLLGYGWSTRFGLNDPCNASPADQLKFLKPADVAVCKALHPDPLFHAFHFTNSEAARDQLAHVVGHVIETVGVKQVSFFAWSRGANVVGGYTIRHPENVRSLVLLASEFGSATNPPVPVPQPGASLLVADRAQSFLSWTTQLEQPYPVDKPDPNACPGEREPAILDAIWRSTRSRDPVGSQWGSPDPVTGGVRRSPTWDLWGWNVTTAAEVTTPTLVMSGLRDTTNPLREKQQPLYDALGTNALIKADKVLLKIDCATHQALWEGSASAEWKGPHATLHEAAAEWIVSGTFQRKKNGTFTVDSAGCARSDQQLASPPPEIQHEDHGDHED